ncbi:WAT1-related protein At5g45370-like [Papaver somniferum]|uniref:WAT1-related protein At5g45370-like n=1 Tax=Papaver somniferum TaxID=3469 RepID=UPI000E6F6316|nr:WAT1-related protein At5g45370-like [Papaver somniferum]
MDVAPVIKSSSGNVLMLNVGAIVLRIKQHLCTHNIIHDIPDHILNNFPLLPEEAAIELQAGNTIGSKGYTGYYGERGITGGADLALQWAKEMQQTNIAISAESMNILDRFKFLYNEAAQGRFHLSYYERSNTKEDKNGKMDINPISFVLLNLRIINRSQNMETFDLAILCKNKISRLSGASIANKTLLWKSHSTLAMVQILYGGYHIISSVALNDGINEIVFCVYRDLISLSLLAPVACFRDKRIRLPINFSLLVSFFFLGLTGVFGNQLLFLMGLGYTNPTYVVVVQPAIPVFTFVLAAFMGTEKVNLMKIGGQLKVGGTIVCVSGDILMVLFKRSSIFGEDVTELLHGAAATNDLIVGAQPEPAGGLISGLLGIGLTKFHIGMLCLIGNCFCMDVYLSFQAPLLLKYPASLSVTAYSYFFGAMFMVIAGISATDGNTVWFTPGYDLKKHD